MIESHRKIVQTNIQSLNVCLQSWTSQDQPDEVKHTEKEDTMNRPGAEGMDAVTYNKEFDHAAIEIGAEQHQSLGLADVVKSLFMWVETPKERVLKNHDGALPQS